MLCNQGSRGLIGETGFNFTPAPECMKDGRGQTPWSSGLVFIANEFERLQYGQVARKERRLRAATRRPIPCRPFPFHRRRAPVKQPLR